MREVLRNLMRPIGTSVIRMIQYNDIIRNEQREHAISILFVISLEKLLTYRHNIEKKESVLIPISKLNKLDMLYYKCCKTELS